MQWIICILFVFNLSLQYLYTQEKEVILQEIEVKDGDTLWSVANYYLKDPRAWPEILKYNKLPSSDPNIILPGMKLKVPVLLVKEHLRPAYLVELINDVKYRKKNTIDWKKAILDMALYNEDGLRTFSNSSAKVKFLTGEIVHLDENSLVILRPEEKREEVELFSGAIKASKAKVITESAVIDPKTEKTDFRTKIKPDKTTLVEVFEGIVDVTAQGKTVTLGKGFGTEVKFMKPPSNPVPLPQLPEFETKTIEKATTVKGSKIEDKIEKTDFVKDTLDLNLKPIESIKKQKEDKKETAKIISANLVNYHLQISKDIEFKNIVVDEIKEIKQELKLALDKEKLKDGQYYYRVSYIDELGFESKFSPVRSFIIDTTPPEIEILKPEENEEIIDEFIYIEGKTEPGVYLTVNDKEILPDETGKFETALMSKKGKNTIVFLAKDKAGNIKKVERNVYKVTKITYKKTPSKLQKKEKDWWSTPAGISVSIVTFLIILGVLVFILKP